MKAFPSDILDVATIKRRHIGIETEILVKQILPNAKSKLEQGDMRQCLRIGFAEFRTIPIQVRSLHAKTGTTRVKKYFDTLKPITKVVDGAGTHLHISILDKDHPNMEANVVALTSAFYKEFQKVSGRRTSWARRPNVNSIQQAKNMVDRMRFRDGRRLYGREYLMITPSAHKTLEFRGPVGSNNADEVLAWAEFLENVIKVCNRKSIDGVQFKDLLVGERISTYVKKLPINRKLSGAEKNKKLNELQLV